MKQSILVLLSLFLTLSMKSQIIPAIENQSPGSRGNSIISYTEGDGQVFWTDALVHPEGFFTLVGAVLSEGSHYLALARFLPDGTPDCTFHNEGIIEFSIPIDWEYLVKIARTKEGKMLVLFNPPQEESALYLARFFEDGFRDPSFGNNGVLRIPLTHPTRFLDMILQEDGKVLVAGFEERPEVGTHTCSVLRLLPDGSVDPGFNFPSPTPSTHSFHLMALASLPEGKSLLAVYKDDRLTVGRILPNGAMDITFGEGGRRMYPIEGFRPYDVQVFSDASWMVIGGGQQTPQGCPIALKGLPDGQPDPHFGDKGILYIPETFDVAASSLIQPDGKWLAAGMTLGEDMVSYFIVRGFLPDGKPDHSFGSKGVVIPCFEDDYRQGSAMFIKPLGGGETMVGGTVNFKGALAQLDEKGRLVESFGKNGMSLSVWGGRNPLDMDCYKVLSMEDGSLVAAGAARKPFDSEILYIRLESNGALDSNFAHRSFLTPNPITGIDAVLQPDGKLIVGGRRKTAKGLDFVACRMNPDGNLDATFAEGGCIAFDRGPFDLLGGIALQSDGKILLAGDMENQETFDRELVVYRLLPDGTPDPSFGNEGVCVLSHFPSGRFAGMLLQQNGKILLLDICHPQHFDLIRLLPNGRRDLSFGVDGLANGAFTEGPMYLHSLQSAISIDNRILVAGQKGNQVGIMRFHSFGEPDLSFGKNGGALFTLPETFLKMAVLEDGKVLLAGSGQSDVAPHYYFFGARFTPEGVPDPSFGDNGLLVTELAGLSQLSSLLPMEDGSVILGGKGYASESGMHMGIVLVRYLAELNAGHLCPAHIFPFLSVYPYPIQTGEFNLTYDIPERSNVIVSLHRHDGSEAALLLDICRLEGKHTETIPFPAGLAEGDYILRIRTEQAETEIRILYRPLLK